MKLAKKIEKKDLLELHLEDVDLALLFLVNEFAYQAGADEAIATREHPQVGVTKFKITGKNPNKILLSAIKNAKKTYAELGKYFK
jgi:hypothetical protein